MRNCGVRASPILELESGEVLPGAVEVEPEVEAAGLDGGGCEVSLEVGEERAGGFGGGLVLDDDVGMEGLAVLRDEVGGEGGGEFAVQVHESWGGKGEGDAAAEGTKAGDGEVEEGMSGGNGLDGGARGLGVGQLVEEGEVGGDDVAFGWEVEAAEGFEVGLGFEGDCEGEDKGRHAIG